MQILLIDADSRIPNLALMKLSAYHKKLNDEVVLKELKIPYYPEQKTYNSYYSTEGFDKVYISIVFDTTLNKIKKGTSIIGGTGYSLSIELPLEIEDMEPDYSIYPYNNISYGFITRGCIRKCPFCKVPEKEGTIHIVSSVDKIVRHKITKFLDNNILAYNRHKEVLKELVDKNIKCQFNQGLDIRLIDEENSILLSKLNYYKEYIFAFDDIKYENIIREKLKLMLWRKPWQLKFFVYVDITMTKEETEERINFLKDNQCLPYIMRNISCWSSPYRKWYNDIAAWCNQPGLFKTLDFDEFCKRRYKDDHRASCVAR
jgi:hypothetical protein